MATRCHIAYETNSGSFRGCYTHWDGYPTGVLARALQVIEHYGWDAFKAIIERGIAGDGISDWDHESPIEKININFIDRFDGISSGVAITSVEQMENGDTDYGYIVRKDGTTIIHEWD